MKLRMATEADLLAVSQSTISRGPKNPSAVIDYVYALEHEGVTLAVGGFRSVNATSAWAWFDLAAPAMQQIRTVYRTTCELLDTLMREQGWTLVMAVVDPTFPEAIRTAEHLGFEFQFLLKRYFGKEPAMLYSRFAKE
jgi:hypothetical protein